MSAIEPSVHTMAAIGNTRELESLKSKEEAKSEGNPFVSQDKQGDTPLHLAIRHHQHDTIKWLIENDGVSLIRNAMGKNILEEAIACDPPIERGVLASMLKVATKYSKDEQREFISRLPGHYPNILSYATCFFDAKILTEIVDFIKKTTSDVGPDEKAFAKVPLHDKYATSTTPLHFVIYSVPPDEAIKKIDLLIENGFDLEAKDANGDTVLLRAIKYLPKSMMVFPEVLKCLLDHHADVTALTMDKKQAFSLLIESHEQKEKDYESVGYSPQGLKALDTSRRALPILLQGLLNQAAMLPLEKQHQLFKGGVNVLGFAASISSELYEQVKQKVLERAHDGPKLLDLINDSVTQGNTLVHRLLGLQNMDQGSSFFLREVVPLIKLLGNRLIIQNNNGETALHIAYKQGNYAMAQEILNEVGPTRLSDMLLAKDKSGETPWSILLKRVSSKWVEGQHSYSAREKYPTELAGYAFLIKSIDNYCTPEQKRTLFDDSEGNVMIHAAKAEYGRLGPLESRETSLVRQTIRKYSEIQACLNDLSAIFPLSFSTVPSFPVPLRVVAWSHVVFDEHPAVPGVVYKIDLSGVFKVAHKITFPELRKLSPHISRVDLSGNDLHLSISLLKNLILKKAVDKEWLPQTVTEVALTPDVYLNRKKLRSLFERDQFADNVSKLTLEESTRYCSQLKPYLWLIMDRNKNFSDKLNSLPDATKKAVFAEFGPTLMTALTHKSSARLSAFIQRCTNEHLVPFGKESFADYQDAAEVLFRLMGEKDAETQPNIDTLLDNIRSSTPKQRAAWMKTFQKEVERLDKKDVDIREGIKWLCTAQLEKQYPNKRFTRDMESIAERLRGVGLFELKAACPDLGQRFIQLIALDKKLAPKDRSATRLILSLDHVSFRREFPEISRPEEPDEVTEAMVVAVPTGECLDGSFAQKKADWWSVTKEPGKGLKEPLLKGSDGDGGGGGGGGPVLSG